MVRSFDKLSMCVFVKNQIKDFRVYQNLDKSFDVVRVSHACNASTLLIDGLGSLQPNVELLRLQILDTKLQQVPTLPECPLLGKHKAGEDLAKSVIHVVISQVFLSALLVDLGFNSICQAQEKAINERFVEHLLAVHQHIADVEGVSDGCLVVLEKGEHQLEAAVRPKLVDELNELHALAGRPLCDKDNFAIFNASHIFFVLHFIWA